MVKGCIFNISWYTCHGLSDDSTFLSTSSRLLVDGSTLKDMQSCRNRIGRLGLLGLVLFYVKIITKYVLLHCRFLEVHIDILQVGVAARISRKINLIAHNVNFTHFAGHFHNPPRRTTVIPRYTREKQLEAKTY